MTTLSETLPLFNAYILAKGKTDNYAGWATRIMRVVIRDIGDFDLRAISKDDMILYLAELRKRLAKSSFDSYKRGMKVYFAWASNHYNKSVYLWGSSYSSSLVLIVAKENDKVHTVLSFSPGEYLAPVNVQNTISGLAKPTFITSSKAEAPTAKKLFDVVTANKKVQFVPNGGGEHGSRALWVGQDGAEEYWSSITQFLSKIN